MAVIVTVPSETPVTRPELETVAIVLFDDVQVTVLPLRAEPAALRGEAES